MAEPDPIRRSKLVSVSAMDLWMVAFTHESFNPNIGYNYEEFEKLGDGVMKTAFTSYLMKRFPNIDKSDITLFQNFFLTKHHQPEIARKYGLNKYLRAAYDTNIHMSEDVLESFFGALFEVGNNIKLGLGYKYAYNTIVTIYNGVNLSKNDIAGGLKDPITQVKEIFEQNFWRKGGPIEDAVQDTTSGGWVFYVKYTPKAIDDLTQAGRRIITDILAQSRGNTRKTAKNKAYEEALRTLKSFGYTVNQKNEFANPIYAPYYPNALENARSQGITSLFFKSKTFTNGAYAQLIGEDSTGYQRVLITVEDSSEQSAKVEALRRYATHKQ